MPLYGPPAAASAGYATVQDEGSAVTQRTTLNVVGPGAQVVDNASKTELRIGDYASSAFLRDDFIATYNSNSGLLGELGWTAAGTVAPSPTLSAAEQSHPGVLRMNSTATINNVAYMALRRNVNSPTSIHTADTFDMVWVIKSTQTTQTTYRFGLLGSAPADDPPASGIYFENISGASAASWIMTSRSSSTSSTQDSGVALSANWITLRIRRVGATIIGSVNGTDLTAISTNIPSIASIVGMQIKCTEAVDKTVDVDYFHLALTGLSR